MTTFGERYLRTWEYWREQHPGAGDREQDFAAALGIPPSSLSPYKNRVKPPVSEQVALIAKVAGVDPGWLMFGDDSEAPGPGYRVTDYEPILDPTDEELGIRPAPPIIPYIEEDDAHEAAS